MVQTARANIQRAYQAQIDRDNGLAAAPRAAAAIRVFR
jgi:hypothetical protein